MAASNCFSLQVAFYVLQYRQTTHMPGIGPTLWCERRRAAWIRAPLSSPPACPRAWAISSPCSASARSPWLSASSPRSSRRARLGSLWSRATTPRSWSAIWPRAGWFSCATRTTGRRTCSIPPSSGSDICVTSAGRCSSRPWIFHFLLRRRWTRCSRAARSWPALSAGAPAGTRY